MHPVWLWTFISSDSVRLDRPIVLCYASRGLYTGSQLYHNKSMLRAKPKNLRCKWAKKCRDPLRSFIMTRCMRHFSTDRTNNMAKKLRVSQLPGKEYL